MMSVKFVEQLMLSTPPLKNVAQENAVPLNNIEEKWRVSVHVKDGAMDQLVAVLPFCSS